MRVNRSFGKDIVPCSGLQALLATPAARIGIFDDLRLGQTSRLLVLTSPQGEAVISEACPACGSKLRP